MSATVQLAGEDTLIVCPTRDISLKGCFLETAQVLEVGAELSISLMDHTRGVALGLEGRVARRVPGDSDGVGAGIGVHLSAPPPEWNQLVAHYQKGEGGDARTRRLRVLVVGDQNHQRGALALYVTSGWDIRFASDVNGATEALSSGVSLDAIIAEYDVRDSRWQDILGAARELQPDARRVLRSTLRGRQPELPEDLVHHTVAYEAGLDALVDALAEAS